MEGLNLILLLCTGLFAFGNTFSQDSDAGKTVANLIGMHD